MAKKIIKPVAKKQAVAKKKIIAKGPAKRSISKPVKAKPEDVKTGIVNLKEVQNSKPQKVRREIENGVIQTTKILTAEGWKRARAKAESKR